MPDALELLKTRRSVKPMELTGPGPTPSEIDTLLTIASRVPDHGKLAPWRFILFEGNARSAAGEAIASAFRADRPDASPDQIDFERKRLARAPLVIAVISRAGPHVKDSRMGAATFRRRLRHESLSLRPMPWVMPQPGSPNGTPMIGVCSTFLVLPLTSASPVSSTLDARSSRRRNGTGLSLTQLSHGSAVKEPIDSLRHLTFM